MVYIDTRYPTQPEAIKCPLYFPIAEEPLPKRLNPKQKESSQIDEVLEYMKSLGIGSYSYLGKSASSLLYLYLSWTKRNSSVGRIAVPAFCCHTVLSAILSSDYEPVFIDISEDFQISHQSVMYAHKMGCDKLLWPNYFGYRKRNPKVLELASNLGIEIILDEAQATFPNELNSSHEVQLFSFGPSKSIRSISGAAISFDTQLALQEFCDYCTSMKDSGTSDMSENRLRSESAIRRFKHQDEHLNHILHRAHRFTPQDVDLGSAMELSFLMNQFHEYERWYSTMLEFFEKSKKLLQSAYGTECTRPLNSVEGLPSVLCIELPAEKRFQIAGSLSLLGIQTTWFYFPLNKTTVGSKMLSEPTPYSDYLASTLLMFPFSWQHICRNNLFYDWMSNENIED